MEKKVSKRSTGNKIYSMVGWFCYIACTIISAILNIYLLSNLDSSNWKFFMLVMSLALEFGKAYVLIRANTYRSLSEYLKNCKFKATKVKKREFTFYGIYLLFAALSITASLGFSLTITDKTEQGFELGKAGIERNISTLENYNKDEEKLEQSLLSLNEKIDELENKSKELDKSTNSLTKKIANEKGWDINTSSNKIWNLPEYRLSDEKIEFDGVRKEIKKCETERDRLNEKLNETKENKESFILVNGNKQELDNKLDALKNKEKEEAGSSKMFILLAETFGIPDQVKKIKFFILLFVSLLVELCIWLSSPDLKLDGDLLYSFRNDIGLSNKRDVDKLLKEIKETNTRFSFKKEEKKQDVKIIEKTPEKVLKEIDNYKEQIEILNREKEELFEKTLENPESVINDEKLKDLKDKLIDLRNKNNISAKENKEKMQKKDAEIKDLKEELEVSKNNNISLEEKISSFNKEKEDLENKIKEDNDKKYTEEDIKKAVKKTLKKSSDEIERLKKMSINWEDEFKKLSEENSNLELTNRSLEKKLLEKESIKNKTVQPAEKELKEMIDKYY